jgi:hypothetical protein
MFLVSWLAGRTDTILLVSVQFYYIGIKGQIFTLVVGLITSAVGAGSDASLTTQLLWWLSICIGPVC